MKKALLFLCFLLPFNYSAQAKIDLKAYLDSVQNAIKNAPTDSQKIISYMNITYNVMTNTDLVTKTLSEFIVFVSNIKDEPTRSFGLRKVGAVYHRLNYFDKALEYYIKTANLCEKMNDKAGLANCYNNMGNAYTSKGELTNNMMNFDRAIDYHLKGIELRLEVLDTNQIMNSYNNIGIAYLKRGSYQDALEYFQKAEAIYRKTSATGLVEDGLDMVLLNIADTYYTLAKKTGKKEYYDKAIEMYSQRMLRVDFNAASERNSTTLNRLGEINIMVGNFEKGLESLHKALEMGIILKSKNTVMEAAYTLAKAYEKKEDHKKASEFLHLYIETKDQLVNEKNMANAEQLQIMFESSTKDSEIEKLNQDKEIKEGVLVRQRIILISSICGILLLLTLGFILLKSYKVKQKANVQLTRAYHSIELKNRQITDSINYAQRIQNSMLIPQENIRKQLPGFFVFFKPRDIVSGDFYWFAEREGKKFFVVADCTGHGVPGAFMSIIGTTLLNEIINHKKIEDPAQILYLLDEGVKSSLQQSNSDQLTQDDGMDISLCVVDGNTLHFAGACQNLYMLNKSGLSVHKGGIFSIGGHHNTHKKTFETILIQAEKGSRIFFSTDGYYDQFGGTEHSKFLVSRFEKLLSDISNENPEKVKLQIAETFENWKGNYRQIDDVLVAGFTIL